MCNKAVGNYVHALEFVPDCRNSQKMCNKAANTYPSEIQFIPDQYKTYEMCVDTCHFVFDSVPDSYKTQEMSDKAVPFFFYLGCLSRTFTFHRTAGEGGGCLFNSSVPLPPASQTTLRH